MYNSAPFEEKRPEVLAQAIAEFPLATLITVDRAGRIESSAIPLLLETRADGVAVLRGHMARANPQFANAAAAGDALAVFSGPQHYVSPSWYPSKHEHGRVVPTWNYVVVHARGPLTFHDGPDWLLDAVTRLTGSQEAGRATPWRVSDAPAEFIAAQVRGIVGVEIEVRELEGKWKVSQNRPVADRLAVAEALAATPGEGAAAMARLVREKSEG